MVLERQEADLGGQSPSYAHIFAISAQTYRHGSLRGGAWAARSRVRCRPVSHIVGPQLPRVVSAQMHAAAEHPEVQKSLASAMARKHSKPSLEHAAAEQGTAAHLP